MPLILSVSPLSEDHLRLRQVLAGGGWVVRAAATAAAAREALRLASVGVVICSGEMPEPGWRGVLAHSQSRAVPPIFIVTSGTADGGLWAEALNLGAYDVLAKPFDGREVLHVVEMAWLRWRAHDHVAYQQAG